MKNEPKASFPGLGCGYLWNVMCKELELLFSVLYCFCDNSLGFGLLKSRTDLQQSVRTGQCSLGGGPTSNITLNPVKKKGSNLQYKLDKCCNNVMGSSEMEAFR